MERVDTMSLITGKMYILRRDFINGKRPKIKYRSHGYRWNGNWYQIKLGDRYLFDRKPMRFEEVRNKWSEIIK